LELNNLSVGKSNTNLETKKKKVPVLPQNQSIVKSYVKYLKYFNVSAKTYGIKVAKTDKCLENEVTESVDDEESKNKAEDHSINNTKSEITFSNFIDRSAHKKNNENTNLNKIEKNPDSNNDQTKNNLQVIESNKFVKIDETKLKNSSLQNKPENRPIEEKLNNKNEQLTVEAKEKIVFFNPFNYNNNNLQFNENELMTYNHTYCTFKTLNTANSNITFNTLNTKESPKTEYTPNTNKTFNNTLYTRSSLSLSRNTHSYMSDAQIIESIVKDNQSKDNKISKEKNVNKLNQDKSKEVKDISDKKEINENEKINHKNTKKEEITYFNIEKTNEIDEIENKKSNSRPNTKKTNNKCNLILF